jgi:hypothetical protein
LGISWVCPPWMRLLQERLITLSKRNCVCRCVPDTRYLRKEKQANIRSPINQ